MNWPSWLLWGFAATVALTTLMAGSEGLGITRMNIPHMLGTMFTPDRDRAKVYGVVLHVLNGWAFSLLYVAGFHAAHLFTWWFGALLGLLHGAFVSGVAMPVMPGVHPRMASALRGPTVARQLEPPGFLGLNYGVRTPISVLITHVAFGAILGGLYKPMTPPAARRCDDLAAPARSAGSRLPEETIVADRAFGAERLALVGLSADRAGGPLEIAQELPRPRLVRGRDLDGHRDDVHRESDQRGGSAAKASGDPLLPQQLGQDLALGGVLGLVHADVAVVGHHPFFNARAPDDNLPAAAFALFPSHFEAIPEAAPEPAAACTGPAAPGRTPAGPPATAASGRAPRPRR
jgi:hypothetical protein